MLSSLKAPGGVSGDASAPSMSTGGAVAATPSESFASSGNDGFVEGETKQPASQYIFEFHGPVGDRADQFIEDIKTQIEEGDLVLFDKNSRQGQELMG
ncbi:hypothetical protein ACJJIP_16590 [Microbulbifer sp. VTAC004]